MAVYSLNDLIVSAKRFSNMERSSFITEDEWIDYINFGIKKYWDMLNHLMQNYHLSEVFFQLTPSRTDYPLPIDFLWCRGVDVSNTIADPSTIETTQNVWSSLMPYQFKERSQYSYNNILLYHPFNRIRYCLYSDFIRFLPIPAQGNWIRLSYTPLSPVLTLLTDSIDGYDGWQEYATAWAAWRALSKAESDTGYVNQIIQIWEDDLRRFAGDRNRDVGDRITLVNRRNAFDMGYLW